ncbi:M20/M25/M40 family metallo-hydrolase [Thermomonas carbonis]|uniref:M20/M25/M40 family metallo-hydrolase n=1 Tax=Thermomonas carbonis TaxID=1463158 RepID=A0A7G9SLL1_9GAMM|nr:M20/M25/M40 family metallo-hydrolase [Thermomonas carbonis]QNN68736.1 M20/M25/M40 family metallo-hydrolase [Thermomonas carbonis]GHC09159.1 peptidase M20 [Thermomonas carbonis]
MTRFHTLACGLLLALSAAPCLAATPSATEQRLRDSIQADQPHAIALLERLVNQNSGSLNIAGVTAVGEMVRAELEPLGFDVQWIDMRATGRAGHLVATHTGKGRGKRLLLIGHLDTVFEPDSTFQRFVRNGDNATGPGIGDDKGGVVIIVSALRAMHATGTLRDADIKVVLTGDEESAGTPLDAARANLVAAGKWADVALEYEGLIVDGGQDFATVARRGVTDWEMTTTGMTGHSSGVFGDGLGYGANYELVRILDTFRRELPEPNVTFNVGLMVGGTPATLDAGGARGSASGKTNIIAERAVARGDLRTLTPEQEARARTRMQAIVAQHLPKTGASLVFEDSYPPMAPTDGNRALLAMLNQVNADLGLPAMGEWDPAKRGAADSSFVAADVDVLAGLGAAGSGSHAEGESVDLTSIPRQALRSAVLIDRLSRTPR